MQKVWERRWEIDGLHKFYILQRSVHADRIPDPQLPRAALFARQTVMTSTIATSSAAAYSAGPQRLRVNCPALDCTCAQSTKSFLFLILLGVPAHPREPFGQILCLPQSHRTRQQCERDKQGVDAGEMFPHSMTAVVTAHDAVIGVQGNDDPFERLARQRE